MYLLRMSEMLQQQWKELLLFFGKMLPQCGVNLLNFAHELPAKHVTGGLYGTLNSLAYGLLRCQGVTQEIIYGQYQGCW